MPIISIIIPVFNTEKWLRRCLDSVLVQSFQDYEVILVDDGSTDGSATILDEYAEKDSRFVVFHEQNRGSSLARRFGIDHSSCEWLVFMDSDDNVHREYIQALYNAAIGCNQMVAACDMQRVANDAEPIPQQLVCPKVLDEKELHRRFFKYEFWGFGGKIYKKAVFNDLYFPEYNINEDYVVMAQIYNRVKTMAYVHNALYYYRTNLESQSHLKLTPRIMDEFYNKKWVLEFYEKNNKQFKTKAKSLLSETVFKLYSIIKNNDSLEYYSDNLLLLKTYIRDSILFITFNNQLPIAVRLLCLKIAIWK